MSPMPPPCPPGIGAPFFSSGISETSASVTGGPLKPGFGLSGDVQKSKISLLFCRGVKLLRLALGLRPGAGALRGLDHKVVGRVWLQVLHPDGVIVVAIRFLGAAPGRFRRFAQRIRSGSILHDAAARSIGGPC